MSTRGDVTVVVEDHYYSHYQHTDMYHSGNMHELLAEAVDVTRTGEWNEVIEGWTSKAWLDFADDDLPKSLRDTVQHPDGEECQRADWSYAMRPRLGHQQMVDAGYQEIADEVFRTGSAYSAPIWGQPSWRTAAQMPAMQKSAGTDPGWLEYGVVVDADNQEIVCLSYRDGAHVPIAVAPLSAPDDIQALADWAAELKARPVSKLDPPPPDGAFDNPSRDWVYIADERFEFHPSVGGPPITPFDPYETYQQRVDGALADLPDAKAMQIEASTRTARNWVQDARNLKDGMWLRPSGFPPLKGTPRSFPAKSKAGDANPFTAAAGDANPFTAAAPASAVARSSCCAHIGVRSKKQCIRPVHADNKHQY